jgi:hypothetical protein
LNQDIALKIYNSAGKLVANQKIITSNSDIQIIPNTELEKGIYLLRFENKNGLSIIKKVAKY